MRDCTLLVPSRPTRRCMCTHVMVILVQTPSHLMVKRCVARDFFYKAKEAGAYFSFWGGSQNRFAHGGVDVYELCACSR